MSNQYTYKPLDKEKIIKFYLNSDRNMVDAAILIGGTRKKLWRSLQYYGLKAKSKGAPGKSKPNAGKGQLTPGRRKYLQYVQERK